MYRVVTYGISNNPPSMFTVVNDAFTANFASVGKTKCRGIFYGLDNRNLIFRPRWIIREEISPVYAAEPFGLLRKGVEPSPSYGPCTNPRLVSTPAPQAFGFPEPMPRPRLVLFRGSGSLHAWPAARRLSPFACCGAALRLLACRRAGCAVPAFAGEPPATSRLGASEPCRLARTFASLGGGLLGHSICHSREIGNPGDPVCHPLLFPQCGFAFNVYSSRAVSFRQSFAGVS